MDHLVPWPSILNGNTSVDNHLQGCSDTVVDCKFVSNSHGWPSSDNMPVLEVGSQVAEGERRR